jgi:transcriptional regulator with XRE-family HTH domain
MSWLHSTRLKYWEILNLGKRYEALREVKNRHPDHKGNYTQAKVGERTKFLRSTLKKIESGETYIQEEVLALLVKDLGLTMEEFKANARPANAPILPPIPLPAPGKEVKRKRRTKAEMEAARAAQSGVAVHHSTAPAITTSASAGPAPAPAPARSGSSFEVTNHTHEGYFVKIEGNKIHIFSDCPENVKSGTYVPPADNPGGVRLLPRKTVIPA